MERFEYGKVKTVATKEEVGKKKVEISVAIYKWLKEVWKYKLLGVATYDKRYKIFNYVGSTSQDYYKVTEEDEVELKKLMQEFDIKTITFTPGYEPDEWGPSSYQSLNYLFYVGEELFRGSVQDLWYVALYDSMSNSEEEDDDCDCDDCGWWD
jgi:hypothetical protein